MEKEMQEFYNPVFKARKLGYALQIDYNSRINSSEKYNKKLNSIAYRMLNALKTNNISAFMDSFINAYMYVMKPIPRLFSDYLNDEIQFKNIGYAFITGMIGEKVEDNNKKGNKGSDIENEENDAEKDLNEND